MNPVQSLAGNRSRLLDAGEVQRTLLRLAHELVERHGGSDRLLLAGIRTRGVPIARRLARLAAGVAGIAPQVCEVDTAAFRDDRTASGRSDAGPAVSADGASVTVTDRTVVLVDDVIYTGRTVRAGIDALLSQGRPAAVEVLVMVDRGHRELPVRATYVGKNVPTAGRDRVQVTLREIDGADGVWLLNGSGG